MRVGVLSCLVVLVPAFAAAAPCADTADCLRTIQKAQEKTTSMTADFVQEKHLQLLDEPLQSRGHLSFRRPDRMRLEITEPMHSTIFINGRDVHVPGMSEKDKQAMAMAPAAAMFTQLGAVFTGATENLQQGFEVTAKPASDDGIDVDLVPRLEAWQRVFRRMQIRFTGPDLQAQQIRLEDALGDRLEVRLENVKQNVDLPDSLFREEATPGAASR